MWLRTENDEIINTDHVKWFHLDGNSITADFGPVVEGEEFSDVKLIVKTFATAGDASAGLDRLMGVLGEPVSL